MREITQNGRYYENGKWAVSYTHLDVYKRQVIDMELLCDLSDGVTIFGFKGQCLLFSLSRSYFRERQTTGTLKSKNRIQTTSIYMSSP